MRKTIAMAALLCCCTLALGQQLNSKGKGPDREIIGSKGNRIHHFLSAPAEASYRAHRAMNDRTGTGPACGSSPPGCTTGPLMYNGGPVMRNPVNYLIFWQPASAGNYAQAFPAGYRTGIENFFENIGGTPYYNIVTQYNDTSGTPVPNAASFGGSWTDTSTSAPSGCDGTPTGAVGATPHCPLTDGDIQNEVSVALAANPGWVQPGINVEYFVYTPSNVGECDGPGTDGNQQCFASSIGLGPSQDGAFCAYHSNNGSTIYAFIPFASNGSCYGPTDVQALGYPNSQTLDIVISPSSHEMIESNTDPHLDAWKGAGDNSDEIGDKCAYIYGYVAPDGTNVVLHGNRFQIQEEFSNDFGSCTKRFGPDPVVANPGTLAFGEVQAGTSSQMGSTIQNNGGGDLNILNMRLGTESDGFAYYSLVNGQPTGATLPGGESLTANVQFAPDANALFGSPSDSLIVDTDQTPCTPVNGSCATSSTTAFADITGTIGVEPDALCNSVTVSTDPNLCSNATASINLGSFDPDGEGVTVTQSPAGPYTLGTTPVLLTVVDNSPDHATAHCSANVVVKDTQKPNISCPAPTTVSCTSSSGAMVAVTPTFSDNCPAVTASCVPSSGSTFGFGSTPVMCTATDASGNMNSCATTVTVADVPPTITSAVASPAVISPPNKKLDPVTILVKDTDVCDPAPVCSISGVSVGGSPAPASDYVITGSLTLELRANGNGGHPMTYIVGVSCSDHHGGSTAAQTSVSAP